MVEIEVNGRPLTVAQDATLIDVLEQLGLDPRGVAVLRGDEVIGRDALGETPAVAGESLEVVRMVGGG